MNWSRRLLYGFLSWLSPFAISMAMYPIKRADPPLFESLIAVVLAGSTMLMFWLYVRGSSSISLREAVAVGILWMAMNVAFDLCLFMEGPMKMTLSRYFEDIGLAYLMVP